jgi:ATP-dependent RNA helicase DeaD
MPDQMGRLKQGVQIIVATPGRLIDLIYNTSCINLTNLKAVVLDEADEMLNMGFIDDIKFIFSCMIHDYQTLFFSATMPEEIHQLTRNILREPVKIELNRSRRAPTSLNHQFHYIKPQEKEEKALELLNRKEVKQAIVFCNTKLGLESLHKKLKNKLSSVEYIHGGLDQNIRTIIFDKFKAQKIRFMLATDVAGRGLDFTHVSHVLNYDFPMDFESYTHRTGRTGRMGSQGQAITFITRRDVRAVYKLIERNNILPEWVGQKPDKPSKDSENYSNGPKRRYSGKKGNPKSAHNKDSAPKQSKPGKRPYKKKKKSQPSDS